MQRIDHYHKQIEANLTVFVVFIIKYNQHCQIQSDFDLLQLMITRIVYDTYLFGVRE